MAWQVRCSLWAIFAYPCATGTGRCEAGMLQNPAIKTRSGMLLRGWDRRLLGLANPQEEGNLSVITPCHLLWEGRWEQTCRPLLSPTRGNSIIYNNPPCYHGRPPRRAPVGVYQVVSEHAANPGSGRGAEAPLTAPFPPPPQQLNTQ